MIQCPKLHSGFPQYRWIPPNRPRQLWEHPIQRVNPRHRFRYLQIQRCQTQRIHPPILPPESNLVPRSPEAGEEEGAPLPGPRSPEAGEEEGAPLPGPRSPEAGEEEGVPLPGPRSPEAGAGEGVPLPGPRSPGATLQNGLKIFFLHWC